MNPTAVSFKEVLAMLAEKPDLAEWIRRDPWLFDDTARLALGHHDGLFGRDRDWSMPDTYHRGYLRGKLARRKLFWTK